MRVSARQRWEQVRTAYVCGQTDLHKLAARFKMDEATLVVRAAAERWEQQRALFVDEVEAKLSDPALQFLAIRRARILAGRLGLMNVISIMAEPQGPKNLAYLMTAAQRALPAQLAVPETYGEEDLADLIVIDADGNVRDEAQDRAPTGDMAPESGRPKLLPGKPK